MKEYNRDTTGWHTYDGREVLIKDMDVRHLVNVINWCKHRDLEAQESHARLQYGDELIAFLEEEAKLRRLRGFANNEPIPKKLETGFYELENETPEEKRISDEITKFHSEGATKQLLESRYERVMRKL
jgi:hypothetical protein